MNKIAQIIPVTRLKRNLHYFDYLIPKDLLRRVKKGQLVEIPFRNKNIKGVIFNLTQQPEKSGIKLKTINQIIDPKSFLNIWQLKLIKFLSDYYFVSQSLLAKMIIPEIPKLQRQSKEKFLANISFVNPPALNIKIDQLLRFKKPVLLRYFNFNKKIIAYLALIKKVSAKNKQILIIVPQLTDIAKIYQYLNEYKDITSVFLNDLAKNKYWQEWLKIKKGQAKIIIGTRSAIFAPFKNLGLIIIDQEENSNHKQEEPNPRYNVKNIALKLKELLNCKLFFASNSPSMSSLHEVARKNWQYLEIDKFKKQPQITIIDKQEEMRKGNYSIFSDELLNKITYHLQRVNKIFLFLNRKGLATLATCRDCGYLSTCPHCSLPLTLHANKQLTCHHCSYKKDLLLSCPKCKSTNIKLTGTGTEKIEQEIKNIFPAAKIIKLDIDTPFYNQDLNKYDIIIGTQYAFNFINWEQIEFISVINADTLFYLPDFQAMEKTFNLLFKLATFINDERKELLIQTFTAKNYIFKAIKKLDYKLFYISELKERKAFNYPPLTKLIKLIYQSIEFNAGQKEIKSVYNKLKEQTQTNKNIIITRPLLAHTQQVRGRFRWQIIIKLLDSQTNIDFLDKLPENIIIDIEPISLL